MNIIGSCRALFDDASYRAYAARGGRGEVPFANLAVVIVAMVIVPSVIIGDTDYISGLLHAARGAWLPFVAALIIYLAVPLLGKVNEKPLLRYGVPVAISAALIGGAWLLFGGVTTSFIVVAAVAGVAAAIGILRGGALVVALASTVCLLSPLLATETVANSAWGAGVASGLALLGIPTYATGTALAACLIAAVAFWVFFEFIELRGSSVYVQRCEEAGSASIDIFETKPLFVVTMAAGLKAWWSQWRLSQQFKAAAKQRQKAAEQAMRADEDRAAEQARQAEEARKAAQARTAPEPASSPREGSAVAAVNAMLDEQSATPRVGFLRDPREVVVEGTVVK